MHFQAWSPGKCLISDTGNMSVCDDLLSRLLIHKDKCTIFIKYYLYGIEHVLEAQSLFLKALHFSDLLRSGQFDLDVKAFAPLGPLPSGQWVYCTHVCKPFEVRCGGFWPCCLLHARKHTAHLSNDFELGL